MKQILVYFYLISIIVVISACNKIDRESVVLRHTVVHNSIDNLSTLTVGNGEFAFTADITGMQSFPEYYENGISTGTFSQWAWHSFPNTQDYVLDDVVKYYQVGNDSVPYWYQFSPIDDERQYGATEWLRENPNRLHLGVIGLELLDKHNEIVQIESIQNARQQLNMWIGELSSTFEIENIPVKVITYSHQSHDMVSFRIESELIEQGRLNVSVKFPYPARGKFNSGYDFNHHEGHHTQIIHKTENEAVFERTLHADSYFAKIKWESNANLTATCEHAYRIVPSPDSQVFELSCYYSPENENIELPSFAQTAQNNRRQWSDFWYSGAAVDFAGSSDVRALELERRVILSQYLTKIQTSGSLPAQETGLTSNSWYGKFHLEMHWWHAVHYILWNRSHLMEEQLQYYADVYEKAKHTAEYQGFEGVRWQKMTDPSGDESPSTIGVFLIWQQPHIIYFTELLYRNSGNIEIIEKYYPLIEATADFMASYARWEPENERYVLGPALIPAQERFAPEKTINPVFELAYWKWGLQTAQNQRRELGLEANEKWQHVIDNLSELPQNEGLYLFTEDATDSYTNPIYLTDHPIVLGIAGFLPLTDYISRDVLLNTFDKLEELWEWETCWGWDFPLAAMCASVLDKPDKAIDYLLMDTQKNTYLLNGHNYQDNDLTLYLPGNGGLLAAVAMMCNYTTSSGKDVFNSQPGWKVKYENFGVDLN